MPHADRLDIRAAELVEGLEPVLVGQRRADLLLLRRGGVPVLLGLQLGAGTGYPSSDNGTE